MTAKGDYTVRARVLEVLQAKSDVWVPYSTLTYLVYQRSDGYSRHALAENIRLLRKEHGHGRIETKVEYNEKLKRRIGYYRWNSHVPEEAAS